MKVITDEQCLAYHAPGHPERPARVQKTLERLREQREFPIDWLTPKAAPESSILRAHTADMVAHVRAAEGSFDNDTPAHPNIFEHAKRSAGAALRAVDEALAGHHAFSLIRPPGHHATRDHAMGFCYLNSIAIAALEALQGRVKSVAILDFDVHHGNGTEAILLNQPGAEFYSIHQHPCYPGTGVSDVGNNCHNYPTAPRTPRLEYRQRIEKAIEDMVAKRPGLILVSAGFDAYARDPLAQETLEAEDFQWIGKRLRSLGIPFLSLLEGGYSSQLPELVMAYLRGVAIG